MAEERALKTPQQKIKKLRKSRIWPSVVFFVVSLLAGAVLLMVEFSLYASYVIDSKFASSLVEAQSVARVIDAHMLNGETPEAAMQAATSGEGDVKQVAIVDEYKRILAANGEVTADLTREVTLDSGVEHKILFDKEFIPLKGLHRETTRELERMYPLEMMMQMSVSMAPQMVGSMGGSQEDATQPLAKWTFWQSVPLDGTEDKALVKSSLVIHQNDLIYGVAMMVVSAVFFVLILTVQFISIVSKVRSNRKMMKLLTTDQTTGGNNWIAFTQQVGKILGKRNSGNAFAIVDISIAKYQAYCSLHGIQAGEQALIRLDSVLASNADGKADAYGHTNGGDFAFFCSYIPGEDGRRQVQARLKGIFEEFANDSDVDEGKNGAKPHFQIDCSNMAIHAGVNLIELPAGSTAKDRKKLDIDQLFVNAKMAMDSIFDEDGDGIGYFSMEMWEEQHWEHEVEQSMQRALDNEEFQVYIQPKYNPTSGVLQGAEALVRWLNPQKGLIPPVRFVPVFEKTGAISKLDDYMISHVAKLQGEWIAQGKEVVPISVNISRVHFANPNLAEHICALVDEYGVPHRYIEIELTESAFFDDKNKLLATVRKLQDAGFDVSMDDFGSGYSSLNSLKDLPLNVLKLDADFFRGEDFGGRGEIVVAEAIALAKQLDMKIVAEGVEKQEQVDFLARQDCDMVQGYYYAKPMPASEYAESL